MEGTIKNLGKNNCKTYFFVRGTDKKEYFARAADIVDEDGEKVRETEAYPFIWVGAKILSFDILPAKEEGKRTELLISGLMTAHPLTADTGRAGQTQSKSSTTGIRRQESRRPQKR